MPTPIKVCCMKCRTSTNKPVARILKDYKMVEFVRKNRKYRFAVGKCPKCKTKIYRALGSDSKRVKKTPSARKKVTKKKSSRA